VTDARRSWTAPEVLAAESLVLGRRDAWVVLGLRILRRATWLVIPLGASFALLAGISQDHLSTEYGSVSDWVHALLSPLWLLTIGILLRVAVAPLAYLVGLGVTLLGRRDVRQATDGRSRWTRRTDALRVAGGLRALRWTIAVRDQAVAMTGRPGRILRVAEGVVGWSIACAWAVFVGVVVARTR